MKFKILVLIVLFILPALCFAQLNQQAMLDSLDGKWERNKNGQPTFSKTFKIPGEGMTTLYYRAMNYIRGPFKRQCTKSAVLRENPLKGNILARGQYRNIYQEVSIWKLNYSTRFQLVVTVEDEFVHVHISPNGYDLFYHYSDGKRECDYLPMSCTYPSNRNSLNKTNELNAFFNSYSKLPVIFEELELALNTPVNQ